MHEPAPVSAKEAAAGLTFHKEVPRGASRSKAPLFAGIATVLLIGAGVAYFMTNRTSAPPVVPSAPPPATLSPEIQAQLERLKEAEGKLKALEDEALKKEEAAKEDTKKKLEAQAKAKGEQVDPAVLQKAQEEAARKARIEQEKKAEEEKKRLEEQRRQEEARLAEQKRLEEAAAATRAAEEKRRQEEAAAAAAAPTPPPAATPAVRVGTLVNLSDPGVLPPETISKVALLYPAIAKRQGVEGTVELSVLVDEKGQVADAQVVRGAGGKAGLNEAAIDNVKKRKYRPATKDGVAVKVWVSVMVNFQLPR